MYDIFDEDEAYRRSAIWNSDSYLNADEIKSYSNENINYRFCSPLPINSESIFSSSSASSINNSKTIYLRAYRFKGKVDYPKIK